MVISYGVALRICHHYAWPAAVARVQKNDQLPAKVRNAASFVHTYGWCFTGISPPKWGIENCFHSAIHIPVYLTRLVAALLLFWRDAFQR